MPETPTGQNGTPPALSPEEKRAIAMSWMDEAPPEELLRHNRLGGIVGQRQQAARNQVRAEIEAEIAEKSRREMAEEFTRLANDDPTEFSRRFLSAQEKERIANQQSELAASIQKDFAAGIGDAFKNFDEWQNLTAEEFARLQKALEGKQGRDVLAAFATTATDIVSDRKAAKRLEEYRAKELPKEREAIHTEVAARNLQSSTRPDLARSAQAQTSFDPTKLDDKAFDKWYRETYLGRV